MNRLDLFLITVDHFYSSIGFSIAKRFGQEGAKVIVNCRKSANVDEAVKKLTAEGLEVSGVVCHVGSSEDRKRLFAEVHIIKYWTKILEITF